MVADPENNVGRFCADRIYKEQRSVRFKGSVEDCCGSDRLVELVSKMPPERYPEAGEVKEGVVNGEQMLVTN